MGYDRGDSFPFDYKPNGILFGSKSNGKLSPRSNPFQFEWETETYKPKQRSYRKTNLKKKVLAPDSPGAEMSGAEMSGAEMSSAETAAPNRWRRNVPDPKITVLGGPFNFGLIVR